MMKKLLVAMVMAVAVPVGMTTVTGFAFVPEAQAFSIKKGLKKVGRGAKKVGKGAWKVAKCVAKGGCATIGPRPVGNPRNRHRQR